MTDFQFNTGVIKEVADERRRAHEKHGADSIEAIVASDPRWLSILVEEGGEAIEEAIQNYMFAAILGKRLGNVAHLHTVTAADHDDKSWPVLRKELIQTLGVCWAWIDAGDRAEAEKPHPFQSDDRIGEGDDDVCAVCGGDPGDGVHSDTTTAMHPFNHGDRVKHRTDLNNDAVIPWTVVETGFSEEGDPWFTTSATGQRMFAGEYVSVEEQMTEEHDG